MIKLPEFSYLEPQTVDQALAVLMENGQDARVLAGGTDLLVAIKHGAPAPKYVVNIKKTSPALSYIRYDEQELVVRIGATTLLHDIETSTLIREQFPILAQAAHSVGSYQVRNRATIGGNICRASPSADNAPGLIALGAQARIAGTGGDRSISLEEFFVGPGKTVLQPNELLREIQVPLCGANAFALYVKHSVRRAMDLATVGVAVALRFQHGSNVVSQARIVLGAVAPRPIRAYRAETLLVDRELDDGLLAEVGELASQEASPISDVRASAVYRQEMIKVITRRALVEAASYAGGGR